ncbi:MAG: hypothetical protein HY667_04735 [Chloroflexi bacterium]|nr:hypothetical protein [Chloroflexota bacterium]
MANMKTLLKIKQGPWSRTLTVLGRTWVASGWKLQALDLPLRDELVRQLCAIGVEARPTKMNQSVQRAGRWPRALIDISQSPIRWVSIKASHSSDIPHTFIYWVPEPRHVPKVKMKVERNVFYIYDYDFCKTIDQTFRNDSAIMNEIKVGGPVVVESSPEYACWFIEEEGELWPSMRKSRWECHERIAKYLLATTIPT